MADAKLPPMHDGFAQWYSEVSLGEDRARHQARWEGVSNVSRGADRATVETLLRLAHRSRQPPSATALEKLRRGFRATDAAFPTSGNDRELQVLAGACLAVILEADNDAASLAALACTTTGFGGARRPALPMDLDALGECALLRRGNVTRRRPPILDDAPPLRRAPDFSKAATKAKEGTPEAIAEAFALAGAAARNAINRLSQAQHAAFRAFDRFLRLQDEELDMLSWLIGERSADYGCGFTGIPANARPLVLGKELADMTTSLPGPVSVQAILSRAGLKRRNKLPITTAVNSAKPEWLRAVLGELNPSPVTTPVHDAIRRQLETGPGQDWVAGWAATAGVTAEYALSNVVLGRLFYRERLFLMLG